MNTYKLTPCSGRLSYSLWIRSIYKDICIVQSETEKFARRWVGDHFLNHTMTEFTDRRKPTVHNSKTPWEDIDLAKQKIVSDLG